MLPYLVFAAGLAAVMWGMWGFAALARRRGVDSALMSIADDLYHPAAKQQQQEHRVEEQRMAPRPTPSDDE
ncbi:MAG TPA: hypothetical protein VNP92_06835 [Actinophytocola sp.]|nr:hypothetical protein [Actinophytocola sp.]